MAKRAPMLPEVMFELVVGLAIGRDDELLSSLSGGCGGCSANGRREVAYRVTGGTYWEV